AHELEALAAAGLERVGTVVLMEANGGLVAVDGNLHVGQLDRDAALVDDAVTALVLPGFARALAAGEVLAVGSVVLVDITGTPGGSPGTHGALDFGHLGIGAGFHGYRGRGRLGFSRRRGGWYWRRSGLGCRCGRWCGSGRRRRA